MGKITAPSSDAWSQAIAYIWNNRPDLAQHYSERGWDISNWNSVVMAVMDWMSYPVNTQWGMDPIALATELGYTGDGQSGKVWIRGDDGTFKQVDAGDLTPDYTGINPWQRLTADAQEYWNIEGWSIDPSWDIQKKYPGGEFKTVAGGSGQIERMYYTFEIPAGAETPEGATVFQFGGKTYATVLTPQVYQWKNKVTGEYRFSPLDEQRTWQPVNPGSIPTITGAGQAQQSWNFDDVVSMLGVDPSNIPWAVRSDWAPTTAMQEILKDPRYLPTSLMMMQQDKSQQQGIQTVSSFLQGTPFVQNLIDAAGGGRATGQSGFSFISGRQLPVRQTLGTISSEGSSGRTANLMSGLAEFSGQNAPSFWSEFEHYLPKGEKASPTRFI